MTAEENVALQERFGAEVANGGNVDVIDELLAPSFVDHDPAPDQAPGPDGLKAFWSAFRTSFPDLELHVDRVVATDEAVAIAYRAQGTHEGEFQGHAGTGRRFDIRGVQITSIVEGRMTERWGSSDQASLLAQLGLG